MSELFGKATKFVVDKVTDIPKPEANIEDVGLKSAAKSGVTYLAKVGVLNPYSHSIPICEISFCLKTDNSRLSPLIQQQTTTTTTTTMSELLEKATKFVVDKIADIPKPEASIDDVDIKSVARSGITYLAKIGVLNPYSHSIPICEISFCLKTDNRVIASGNVPDPGSIEAKETTMLQVPMLVPHDVLMSLVKDMWKDWDIDYELQIGLIVDLPVFGNFTIPLTTKGEIKLPTLGSIFGGGDDEEKEKEKE